MARYLGLSKETVMGTAVAATDYMPIIKESLALSQGYVRPVTVQNRAKLAVIKGQQLVEGDFEALYHPKNLGGWGQVINGFFGSDTVTSKQAGAVGSHVFKVGTTIPSLTLRIGVDAVTEEIYDGNGIDTLTFEQSASDPLHVTAHAVGQNMATGAIGTPVWQSESSQSVFTQDLITTFTVGGSAASPQKFKVTMKNNLEKKSHELKSRNLPRHEPKGVEVTGEMDIRFLTTTHLTNFLNSTTQAIDAIWTGAIIAGTDAYSLEINIPNVTYDAGDAMINAQELVVQGLKFEAVIGSGTDVVVVTQQDNRASAY